MSYSLQILPTNTVKGLMESNLKRLRTQTAVINIQELKPSLNVSVSSEKLLLYQLLLLVMSRQVNVLLQIIFLSLGSRPLIFTIYSFQKLVTVTFENV